MPTNLYGPGDKFNPEGLVASAPIRKCVRLERKATTTSRCGAPKREREFPVDDAAEGIVAAAEHYDGPEPVTSAPHGNSIRDLVEIVVELTGFKGDPLGCLKPDGQPRRSVDGPCQRAVRFEAATDFREGLGAPSTGTWPISSRGTHHLSCRGDDRRQHLDQGAEGVDRSLDAFAQLHRGSQPRTAGADVGLALGWIVDRERMLNDDDDPVTSSTTSANSRIVNSLGFPTFTGSIRIEQATTPISSSTKQKLRVWEPSP